MATRFELVLHGADPVGLRSAGEEALAEISRLDAQLSFYRASSDVSWINAHAADGPVRVEPGLFRLLRRAIDLSNLSDGAFDITVAPLMRAWGFTRGAGARPSSSALDAARAAVGFRFIDLDDGASTIAFRRRGMSIDFGAAGKGCAIDRAMEILRGHGVTQALLHGGTSSVHALDPPDGESAWRVAWRPPGGAPRTFALRHAALSISAVHGKSFVEGGREHGHVMDPRTGLTSAGPRAAAVTGPDSLECDALSTALLVNGGAWLRSLSARFAGYDGAVA